MKNIIYLSIISILLITVSCKKEKQSIPEKSTVIKNYIIQRREPITKIVYSSAVTGKLFNSKKSVIDDFTKNHITSLPLVEVPSQNRFELHEEFLSFIQSKVNEDEISTFVEELSKLPGFDSFVGGWLEEEAAG
jgi:hypothetical protein